MRKSATTLRDQKGEHLLPWPGRDAPSERRDQNHRPAVSCSLLIGCFQSAADPDWNTPCVLGQVMLASPRYSERITAGAR